MSNTVKKGKTVLGDNGTFSGADMIAHIIFPGRSPITLGQITTMTYSTYRETHPVRTLGRINVKGFSKGPRTIAGTIIFTVFNKHVVNAIKEELKGNKDEIDYISYIRKLKPCELPPFDIMITFGNEYGSSAKLFIYGIEVVDEGKVFSVEDMFTENTWSYMARDIDLMDDIDAEQNAPLIALGELETAGKFKVGDLVMDDAYVKMQAELDKMKKDKDAAIQAAREQAKDYISTAENWGFEETTIPQTNIPGGDGTADQLPVDPNHKDCKKPKLEIYNGFDVGLKVGENDRKIYFRIDTKDLAMSQQKDAFEIINGTKGEKIRRVTLSWSCDGGGASWVVSFKTKVFGGIINPLVQTIDTTLVIKDYYSHKPEPVNLKLKMSNFKLSDGTSIRVQSPATIELKTNDGKTEFKPVTFKLIREGTNTDSKDKDQDAITCDITFAPISQALTGSPGQPEMGQYCQFFYRDATNIGYEFVKDKRAKPALDTYKPEGLPVENDYITPNESWMNSIRISKINSDQITVHGRSEKCKHIGHNPTTGGFKLYEKFGLIRAGFSTNITCKKGGKPLSSKEMKDFYLKFDYKVIATVRGTKCVFDGDKQNNNVVKYNLDDETKAWFRTNKIYKVSDLNSKKKYIAIEDDDISFLQNRTTQYYPRGIARTIFDAVHALHDGGKRPKFTEDVEWYNDPKNCKCRFKYSDMTLVLYNFKVYNGPGTSAKQLKTGTIKGVNSNNELIFPISNMDDRVLQNILAKG